MIKCNESAIRVVEVYNALAVILPIYDEEARRVYNGVFHQDIADLIPAFFKDIARLSIKNPKEFTVFMNFMYESIRYIRGDRLDMPMSNSNNDYFIVERDRAKKLLKAWNIKIE